MSTSAPQTERRAHPRVVARAPLFARALTRSAGLADGGELSGRLLDASRGGVAFATDRPVRRGDLVELSIEDEEQAPCLRNVFAQVVDTSPHPVHDLVVRCRFAQPTEDDGWLAALDPGGRPGG